MSLVCDTGQSKIRIYYLEDISKKYIASHYGNQSFSVTIAV